jgi:replicative DNA helicase
MTETATTPVASLSDFGRSFQEKVVQALLVDQQYAENMLEVFDPNYFDLRYLSFLSERYFKYAKQYKVFPSLQLLVTIVKDELKSSATDAVLREQAVEYLKRIRSNPDQNDLPYVKDKSLEFCRKQALKGAIEKAIDDIQKEDYGSLVNDIKKALCVGTTPSLGTDFLEEIDARYIYEARNPIATGLPQLDHKLILKGGLGKGQLGCMIGCTGSGKSHFLVSLGAHAMLLGKNVLYYTFELAEADVGIRFDSNLCELDSNECTEYDEMSHDFINKQKVLDKYDELKGNLGALRIKYFGGPSLQMLASHMERLSLKGFIPDVVLIDMADCMQSSHKYEAKRYELELIYKELRDFAVDKKLPIWTATQSNRSGTNAEVVDLDNMSEAYSKAGICDVVMTISRKSLEKASGGGRLFVAKNRNGRDGLLFPIHIDTAQSRFKILSDAYQPGQACAEDEDDLKKQLRDKWKKLENVTK